MNQRVVAQLLKPFGQIHQKEAPTAILMFLYSFLVMTAYSVIKPATRSKFIESLGSDNLPYIQLAAGALIGFVMAAYGWQLTRLPRRWSLAIAQGEIVLVLLVFWYLFRSGQAWVAAAFYLVGLILGVLLISQFWTLANLLFDPRQAKRLFGFIGGGSALGGVLGSSMAVYFAERFGTEALLLFSAGFLVMSILAARMVVQREGFGEDVQSGMASMERGVGGKKAMQLLRKSKHLRSIALVIGFAGIGAAIIEQQLNMAADTAFGPQSTEEITIFLANIQFWASLIGFLIQVLLTSRIHRYLGIGFALLMLPISLGSTAMIMLLNAALWAPGLARVIDQSLRYSIDKTTREVLYMPLPSDIKFTAKPFVDVTVDRFAKGLAAALLLFLIQPWGLELTWQSLSYANMAIAGAWIFMALRARREYRQAFRNSIFTREIKPEEVPVTVVDLATIETLVQELASPEEKRVLYAIEFLESLNKRQLITPLLLFHESPIVRARALSVMSAVQHEISARWLPAIRSMITDADPNVRSAAVGALASMHHRQVRDLIRPLLRDQNPRIALTAAMVMAGSSLEEDADSAGDVLNRLVTDKSESATPVRRDFAIAIRQVPVPRFRRLLIPLLNDSNPEVVEEAMRSIRKIGAKDVIFIPTFLSLLSNRRQKGSARELLVGFGEMALPILSHFLKDPEENIWIRRHIPEVLAHIPCQRAMDILVEALDEKDGFLRFHVIAALERIHRVEPEIMLNRRRIETLIQVEISRYRLQRRLHRILFESHNYPEDSLLACALVEKMKRGVDRIYRLLSLIYPWKDIVASRKTIEHGDARSRAGSLEYLDNILASGLRKTLLPLLEDAPQEEPSFPFNRTGIDVESSVLRLIHDEDPVVASAAIYFVWQQKLTNLVDKLKQVTATRDMQDRHVPETASWVLQEFCASVPKQSFGEFETLPSVDLVNQLRNLPLFGAVTVDEIFRICGIGRQVCYRPGRLLYQDSLVPETVQFLLKGSVGVERPGGETRRIEAPAALAFREVLEEQPMAESVRTTDVAVCLTVTSEEILTLLADNSDLVPGLFQTLWMHSPTERVIVKGNQPLGSGMISDRNYNSIEKGLILKAIPVFSQVSPEEIIALAAVAAEIPIEAGMELIRRDDRPAIYAMISGALSIEGNMEPSLTAEPSDVIGLYETLAGIDFEFNARVKQDGIVLRIGREDLFDLLGQRSALLRQVFGALFRNYSADSHIN